MATEYVDIFSLELAVEDNGSNNAFQKLLDNVGSDRPEKRHVAALNLAEAFALVNGNEKDSIQVLSTLQQFVDDPETSIRRMLMLQLTDLTTSLRESPSYKRFLSEYIFPTFLKSSVDADVEVRKAAQANLMAFARLQSLTKGENKQLLALMVEHVGTNQPEELRIEMISLMASMAVVVDMETTRSCLLPTFMSLCSELAFNVRKACAMNFGKMCENVDQLCVETDLLPKFTGLCQDSVWGIRKTCAESFVDVSRLCTVTTRQDLLVRFLLGLLNDVSRWVRASAYQALGPFIATFAQRDATESLAAGEKTDTLMAADGSRLTPVSDTDASGSVSESTLPVCTDNQSTDSFINPDTDIHIFKESQGTVIQGSKAESETKSECESKSETENESKCETESKSETESESKCETESEVLLESSLKSLPSTTDSDISESTKKSSDNMSESCAEANKVADIMSGEAEIVSSHNKSMLAAHNVNIEKVSDALSPDDTGVPKDCNNLVMTEGTSSNTDFSKDKLSPADIASEISSVAKASDRFTDDVRTVRDKFLNTTQPLTDKVSDDGFSEDIATVVEDDSNFLKSTDGVKVMKDLFSALRTNEQNSDSFDNLDGMCGSITREDITKESFAKNDEVRENTTEENDSEDIEVFSDAPAVAEKLHTASLSVVSEPGEETVRNIGSMHVHVTNELNIVDGLVEPAESLVKINITRQAIVTLEQESLDPEVPKSDDIACRANVVHIPSESPSKSTGRPFLLKRGQGMNRFGYQLHPQRAAYYEDESDDEALVNPETASLEMANKALAANQDMVPCELLEQFLNMAEPSRAQTVDSEILKHCAFSLPAVAYTLGQKNWACLRQLYHFLARNMQWQVRRTLALSIHEMASILGGSLITTELLPVFDELIKDLDEVRSGIVKHLSLFLQLLPDSVRISYLPKLEGFLVTETNTRWRYRQDFAQQLILLVELFSPNNVHLHLLPLAFVLVSDKVAEVRQSALHLICAIMKTLSEKDHCLLLDVLDNVKQRFLENSIWRYRQLFIFLSQSILDNESMSFGDFLALVLPSLLTLDKDPVPNVRITLSRFLSHVIMTRSDFVTDSKNIHEGQLLETLETLRKDKDADVRYFINPMTGQLLSIV